MPPTALLCPPGSLPGAGGDGGDEAARSVPVADLRTGDVVQVPPGAQLPVDGEVVHGSSEVNEHMVTGEPVPVPKAEGAQVIGGTLNCSGALWVRVGAVGNETVRKRPARTSDSAARHAALQRPQQLSPAARRLGREGVVEPRALGLGQRRLT